MLYVKGYILNIKKVALFYETKSGKSMVKISMTKFNVIFSENIKCNITI